MLAYAVHDCQLMCVPSWTSAFDLSPSAANLCMGLPILRGNCSLWHIYRSNFKLHVSCLCKQAEFRSFAFTHWMHTQCQQQHLVSWQMAACIRRNLMRLLVQMRRMKTQMWVQSLAPSCRAIDMHTVQYFTLSSFSTSANYLFVSGQLLVLFLQMRRSCTS